jgi:acyl-homoserine lactone acylase PvdQ
MMQARVTPAGLDPGPRHQLHPGGELRRDRPVADALLAYSQSTDPASPHSQDQTRAFSEKKWHRLPFTQAEIRRAALGPARRLRE